MISPLNAILETALYARDLDLAEAFYGDILGLEKIGRAANRHVFFRCGKSVVLIFNPDETLKPAYPGALPVPPHGTTGPGHLCFALLTDDFAPWIERLQAAKVQIEADFIWPGGGRSIYFRDPAGNSLECAEPRIWARHQKDM